MGRERHCWYLILLGLLDSQDCPEKSFINKSLTSKQHNLRSQQKDQLKLFADQKPSGLMQMK